MAGLSEFTAFWNVYRERMNVDGRAGFDEPGEFWSEFKQEPIESFWEMLEIAEGKRRQFGKGDKTHLRLWRKHFPKQETHLTNHSHSEYVELEACDLCEGLGIVVVPHPVSIHHGKVEITKGWHEIGASCKCPKGRKIHADAISRADKMGSRAKPVSMDSVEEKIPHWRELLKEGRAWQIGERERKRLAMEAEQKAKGQRPVPDQMCSEYHESIRARILEGIPEVEANPKPEKEAKHLPGSPETLF